MAKAIGKSQEKISEKKKSYFFLFRRIERLEVPVVASLRFTTRSCFNLAKVGTIYLAERLAVCDIVRSGHSLVDPGFAKPGYPRPPGSSSLI